MSYNPTLALNSINPSLVGYTGGIGKAMQAIGGSMSDIGKAKLDLEEQKKKDDLSNAMLKISQNADTRAADAVKQGIVDKAEKKQDTFNENVANNSYLYKAMGLDVPGELTNERAALGLQDPKITALGIKEGKDKYSGTAGGIIFNTGTGQIAGDYRDKSGNKELDGLPSIRSIVGGKERVTYFNFDGSPKLRIDGDGTPIGTYGQYVADSIGDANEGQRPKIKEITNQGITAESLLGKGYFPIRYSSDPKVKAAQEKYRYKFDGFDGDVVPPSLASAYKKQFGLK